MRVVSGSVRAETDYFLCFALSASESRMFVSVVTCSNECGRGMMVKMVRWSEDGFGIEKGDGGVVKEVSGVETKYSRALSKKREEVKIASLTKSSLADPSH